MTPTFAQAVLAGSLLLATFAAGCSLSTPREDPTRYYVLTAQEIRPEAETQEELVRWNLGVRPVDIPGYLRGKSIVVRTGENEIAYRDYARWAESLDKLLARVVQETLSGLRHLGDLHVGAWSAETPVDYTLKLRVLACEGLQDGRVAFRVRWELTPLDSAAGAKSAGPPKAGDYTAEGLRWDGRDHGSLARALSEGAAGLSRQIADALPRQAK